MHVWIVLWGVMYDDWLFEPAPTLDVFAPPLAPETAWTLDVAEPAGEGDD